MSVIDELLADESTAGITARVISTMQAAGVDTTAFIEGEPSEQMLQAFVLLFYWMAAAVKDANRAQFIDTASDPGDLDTQTPGFGWLSARGAHDFNTPRTENTYATGFVTLSNGGGATHTIRPEELTLQNGATSKTYRNSYDASLYLGAGRILTLAPGGTATIPVRAEELGTDSNAAIGEIDTLQSSLSGVTVTNASPVRGTDRETRDKYIARCKLASAATSPNGPSKAYEYIALNTNTDGTLGTPDDGKTKVNVTRLNVSKDNDSGVVFVRLASPSGPAVAEDVTAVTSAINLWALPDTVTVIVAAATALNVDVAGVLTANASPGLTGAVIIAAANAAETEFFADAPVGGFDNALYLNKLSGVAVQSHPATYNCQLSSPASDAFVADSEVLVLTSLAFTAVLQ